MLALDSFIREHGAGYQHGNRNGCLKGTRECVLHEIRCWAEDPTKPPIFWLNGLAGTGKSAIIQTVVEWCDACHLLGTFFFCSRDHGNPCLIFPILAVQLALKHPQLRSIIVSVLQSNPDVVYEPPSDQMEVLIVEPLRAVGVPTLIIIDALDQCGPDHKSQSNILSALGHWVKEIPKVKFLVTSRPETHLLASFRSPLLGGQTNILALHDITQHLVNNDIRLFLEYGLSGLAARNGIENWPTATQLDLLCTRAAGLFVYAAATIRFLDGDDDDTLPSEQYTIIAHSPDDTVHEGTVEGTHGGLSLDSLCLTVLQASFRDNDDEDDAIVRSILATTVLVTRPLSPSTIAGLTGLEVREVTSGLQSIRSLVRLDQHVRPFHKLLSDLLTSPTRCADKRFYISPGKYHSDIARNCLRLMNEALEDSIPPQTHTMNSDAEHLFGETALGYACISWHVHLTEAREDITALIPALRQFLEEKFVVWVKVFGTPGAAVGPTLVLNKIIPWLREVCNWSILKHLTMLKHPNQVAKDEQLLNNAEQCLRFVKPSV